jgi:protein ImuB
MRIAVVHVPGFALQSLLRGDPSLAQAPVAVLDGQTLVEVSDAAARLGLRAGLTAPQARAIAPEAILKPRSPALERSAEDALDDLAASFAARFEPAPGEVALDVSDLQRLFPTENQLATAIWLHARKLGLQARVAIARDKRTAHVACLAQEGVTVVPPGREAAFLAPLPIALLAPSELVAQQLVRWGVRRIGELAGLPEGGIALRLGREGAQLALVARGAADDPLQPRSEPLRFEEAFDFEWPVENVEALLFVLKRLIENLTARLACRGLGAGELELELKLDPAFLDASVAAGQGRELRRIVAGAPTREAATLLSLARVQLESSRPTAPVTSLIVRALADRVRQSQLGLFEPAGPSPERLATLLARLRALAGEERVGAPRVGDSHLPDAFTIEPFAPSKRAVAVTLRRLALHAWRPPRAVDVQITRGELRFLRGDGIAGQVLSAAGPFRVRDGWWQREIARDYFDIELSDGALYRMFLDRHAGTWHVDGCYE